MGARARLASVAALAALAGLLLALAAAAPAGAQPGGGASPTRYSIVHGCYGLRSQSLGRFVAKRDGGGYAATAGSVSGAEPFRMQATDLARYLFYGKARDFMAVGSSLPVGSGEGVVTASSPSDAAVWRVDEASGAFRIVASNGRVLSVGEGGQLVLADAGSAGQAALFTFERAGGCPEYPESGVNAAGTPPGGSTAHGDARGVIDLHLHLMAFEFLGGSVRCGRPWHPFGVTHAMVDCPDHGPGGAGAVLENTVSYKNPAGTHDTVGWPTFRDWPNHRSLTHEQIYYRWLERSWRGGLRLFVNLLVDNAVLCEVYPLKRNPCDEMNTARLEYERTLELQDYIDAQSGGPGKGWFRIVRDPFEARRVVNEGKLAVVLGIEVSRLLNCKQFNDVPNCSREDVDRRLDEVYGWGVRQMELINKFDNAFGGVAGDAGDTGVITNVGNKYETGSFWQMQTCEGEAHDHTQHSAPFGHNDDALMSGLQLFMPQGAAPVYPDPPHCNTKGLTDLGEHLIRRMMEKRMIMDPDHLSVLARNQALSLVESKDYSGVVGSHSWSTPDAFPRIYRLGGVVTPYAGDSTGFVEDWRKIRRMRSGKHFFGFGYGADTNGFGSQGPPRGEDAPNKVTYPFTSYDGKVTVDRLRSGERTWDVNTDGVAHYGMYPDWLQDIRNLAGSDGDLLVEDMQRGAEAYLQMWERANGVPQRRCRSVREGFAAGELGRIRLGAFPEQVLRATNQPSGRPGRTYRWCVGDRGERKGTAIAVFSPRQRVGLVASTAPRHKYGGVGTGARAGRLRGRTRSIGSGLLARGGRGGTTIVYGTRNGRVRFVAITTRSIAASRTELRRYLKAAKLI